MCEHFRYAMSGYSFLTNKILTSIAITLLLTEKCWLLMKRHINLHIFSSMFFLFIETWDFFQFLIAEGNFKMSLTQYSLSMLYLSWLVKETTMISPWPTGSLSFLQLIIFWPCWYTSFFLIGKRNKFTSFLTIDPFFALLVHWKLIGKEYFKISLGPKVHEHQLSLIFQ